MPKVSAKRRGRCSSPSPLAGLKRMKRLSSATQIGNSMMMSWKLWMLSSRTSAMT